MDPEKDHGPIEYKRELLHKSTDRIDRLVTQMNYRLSEGDNEAIYIIGVEDDGTINGLERSELDSSIRTLKNIVEKLDADLITLDEQLVKKNRWIAHLLVRKINKNQLVDIRIAVGGHVDSGKSSTIGVLTRGVLDNGRGKSRLSVFNHKHEIESGRTSSISLQILGFDSKGKVMNYSDNGRQNDWQTIVASSIKLISFVDLCGHEKYLKTTITGVASHLPSAMIIVISSNIGITEITKEHIRIALALKIPLIVIITKIDMTPDNIKSQTIENTIRIFKKSHKIPLLTKSKRDLLITLKNFGESEIVPIFQISNVTGDGLNLLREFLNYIPSNKSKFRDDPFKLLIDHTFSVKGVGTVVSGVVASGSYKLGEKLLIGPDGNGKWHPISVRSIHFKKTNIMECKTDQSICFALRNIQRKDIRKGMVIVNPSIARSIWRFKAEVRIVHHHTTISSRFQTVIHCQNVAQTCKINSMTNMEGEKLDLIRSGDRAIVEFEFMIRPVFITEKSHIIFREGNTRGIGTITQIYENKS